jgi:hypothetical protein
MGDSRSSGLIAQYRIEWRCEVTEIPALRLAEYLINAGRIGSVYFKDRTVDRVRGIAVEVERLQLLPESASVAAESNRVNDCG